MTGAVYQETVDVPVTRAYEEIVDFIAAGSSPRDVIDYQPSDAARSRVADLIAREKSGGLTADETSELQNYVQIEHLMRLAKARARQYPASQSRE